MADGRGKNPNSLKALAEARQRTQFSGEIAVKAQKASIRKRKANTNLKELAISGLEKTVKLKNGKKTTYAEAMIDVLKEEVIRHHNMKAWELYRDMCGQKPAEKVMMSSIPTEIMEEVEDMISEYVENDTDTGTGADDP